MKNLALSSILVLLCTLLTSTPICHAQSTMTVTDVPRTISYQGLLSDLSGKALPDGQYRITLSLYADPTGSLKVWQDTYDATLSGGVFNLYLGAGSTPLPDLAAMNTQLWIGTQLADEPEMTPLTPLAASPYALNVPDRAVTTAKLADGAVTAEKVNMDYISGINVNGQAVTGKGRVLNIEGSKDIALDYNAVTNTLRLHREVPATQGDADKGASTLAVTDAVWSLNGDGWEINNGAAAMPAAGDFLGTASNVTFEMRANGQTAMRYQPNGLNTPNIIGGASANSISNASISSTIAGGGTPGTGNTIGNNADFVFIGGGDVNEINGDNSVITGGTLNLIHGVNSVIGGGLNNLIYNDESVISGGAGNTIDGNGSVIAGGNSNTISGPNSSIGGGLHNHILGGSSVIAGGKEDTILAAFASIGGGKKNTILADASVIGGGEFNTAAGLSSTIPGGDRLIATSFAQTVIGALNMSRGASISRPTTLPAANDPIFIIGNGYETFLPPPFGPITNPSNAFEVSYNGHFTVFDKNGTSQVAIPGSRAVIKGSTYTDNILYAWADVEATGAIFDDFGVARITNVGPGIFDVDLNIVDSVGTPVDLATASITATLTAQGPTAQCGFIQCSRIGNVIPNRFRVFTTGPRCEAVNLPFMFHVTGSPFN